MVGIGGAGPDPQTGLTLVAHSENEASGDGRFNAGRFSDPEIDQLIDAIKSEMDTARRDSMIRSALLKLRERAYLIPLHRQMVPWAMRNGVEVVHTPWNALVLQLVKMN